MPPIKCIPCRVRYQGCFYKIQENGEIFHTVIRNGEWLVARFPEKEERAKLIRREASRLRRNRNARERNQARRDLGLKKTPYGWE